MTKRSSLLARILVAAAMLAGAVAGARADDDGDHDLARDLHEKGEIRSFAEIVRAAQEVVSGDVVGVGLRQSGSRWTYVIQIVDAAGFRVTLDIDAESAKLLRRSPAEVAQP